MILVFSHQIVYFQARPASVWVKHGYIYFMGLSKKMHNILKLSILKWKNELNLVTRIQIKSFYV